MIRRIREATSEAPETGVSSAAQEADLERYEPAMM